jgi:hypothetical protein
MTRAGRDRGRDEPLWASSLATQPRPDDVTVHVVERERDEKPPRRRPEGPRPQEPGRPPRQAPARRRQIAAGVALLAVLAAVLAASTGRASIADLSSSWDDISMTCRTLRMEDGPRALEVFSCRSDDGRRLPTGTYASPRTVWQSDVDRREAVATRIRITPGGDLTGWALY